MVGGPVFCFFVFLVCCFSWEDYERNERNKENEKSLGGIICECFFFLLLRRKRKTQLIELRGLDCRGTGGGAERGEGFTDIKAPELVKWKERATKVKLHCAGSLLLQSPSST